MMSANDDLDYRGVKHILAGTSKIIDVKKESRLMESIYTVRFANNTAGYTFHNFYGFGKADVDAAVCYSC